MKPLFQTKFGSEGNCLEACVASLCEAAEVPDFRDDSGWWEDLVAYVRSKGLTAFYFPSDWPITPKGYHIMNGMGPRHRRHSVIGLDGKMVHDPHPEGGGIHRTDSYILLFREATCNECKATIVVNPPIQSQCRMCGAVLLMVGCMFGG